MTGPQMHQVAVNGDALVAQLQALRTMAATAVHLADALLLQLGVAREPAGAGVVNDASEFGSGAAGLPPRFMREPGE